MDKNKGPIHFEISFLSVSSSTQSYLASLMIFVLHFFFYSYLLYSLVDPQFKQRLNLSFNSLVIIQTILVLLFTIFTILSYWKGVFRNFWGYILMGIQACCIVYLQTSISCFSFQNNCSGDIKYKLISIITIIYYTIIIVGLRIFYYYPFQDSTNIFSMNEGNSTIYLYIYRLIIILLTNLLSIDNLQIKKYVNFVLSILIFSLNYRSGFKHPLNSRLWTILYTYILWTSTIIFIIPFFQNVSLHLHLSPITILWYIWGYTTPFVILFSLLLNQSQLNWKIFFTNKQHFIPDISRMLTLCSELKYKIALIRKSQLKTNDTNFKQLWTLINSHNQVCCDVFCPLKALKDIKINRQDDFLQHKRLIKSLQSCLELGRYYLQKLSHQYPNSLDLMIQIANYQFEALHNKQNGLILYNQYYQKKQTLLKQQYALYYLKRKIESVYIENETQSQNNCQNQIANFRHNIEVSVTMLAQFWYFLSDPKCNLKKLYDLANILFPLKIGVDNDWKKISKIKNIQSYHLYARYLIKMFNDKQKGLKILEQASRIEQQLRNRQQVEYGIQQVNSLVQQNGIIFLEFDGVNSGVMFQVNLAAQRMFGYSKGQLLSRKVNDIMPKLYAQHHDKILQHYQQTNKSIMMNKQRYIWGKSKDGYLFPFTIMIKPVKNYYSQTSEVYASLKRQPWLKQIGIIIIDQNQTISEISSSILGIFPNIYNLLNSKKKVNIRQVLEKYDAIVDTSIVKSQTYQFSHARQYQNFNSKQFQCVFNITIEQIKFAVASQVGYMIKFIKTTSSNIVGLSRLQSPSKSQHHQPQQIHPFEFTFKIAKDESQVNEVQEKSILQYDGYPNKYKKVNNISTNFNRISLKSANLFFQSTKLALDPQVYKIKDYKGEIKTKRLCNKVLRQTHSLSDNSEQYNQNERQLQSQDILTQTTIRPSQLSSILQKQSSNSVILSLKILTLVILISCLILYLIQYLNMVLNSNNFMNQLQNYKNLNQLISQTLYLKSYITYFTNFYYDKSQTASFIKQINQLDLYLDYFQFKNYVNVQYSDNTNQTLLLSFALNKLISEANSLKYNIGLFNKSQSNVYYINFNTINGIKTGLEKYKKQIYQQYMGIIKSIQSSCIIFIITASTLLLTLILIKNILLKKVLKRKAEILQIFFQIPRKSCNNFQKECQKFIQKLTIQNQDDQINSLISEQDNNNVNQKNSSKQKKRTVVGQQKTLLYYIIASFLFLLILISFQIFFIIRFQMRKQALIFIGQTVSKVFETQQSFSSFFNSKVSNFQSQNSYIAYPQIPIDNSINQLQIIKYKLNYIQQLSVRIMLNFFHLIRIYDTQFLGKYNKLMYGNLCQNTLLCNSKLSKGLNTILLSYFDQAQKQFQTLMTITNNGVVQPNEIKLLFSKQILDNENQTQNYLKIYWRILCQHISSAAKRFIQYQNMINFAVLLSICLINFTVLLVGWIKFYNILQQKIVATEYILTFIPIDEINKNPKIAKYIRMQILQKQ